MEGQQPGQTITPQPTAASPQNAAPQPVATPPPDAQWQFRNDTTPPAATPESEQADDTQASRFGPDFFSWTASEFVEHSKNIGWYGGLVAATAVLAAIAYLVTKGIISPVVVVVAAIILAVAGAHKPRVLEYRLDHDGLSIGPKMYEYGLFKSFSIIDEGAVPSIRLLPLRRFQPTLTVYYAPTDEEKVVAVLSARLPIEERGLDPIDNLMHRIRF